MPDAMERVLGAEVKKVVIAGGGTAGWMAAAALSERYRDKPLRIRLIESPEIATVGVGEATVPGIRNLHSALKIRELDFIRATGATFKLGIEFRDWHKSGTSFFHPFAAFGTDIANHDFYQCWLRLYRAGLHYDLEDFCLSATLARQGRFAQPDEDATSPLAYYNYAYHFDASLYARFLRGYALERGAEHLAGMVTGVARNAESGCIDSLQLSDGAVITGDLFIDCSGFRSFLIHQCMEVGFEDWSQYLPCDSAVVAQSENFGAPMPHTTSTALSAGWQWHIPLEHRAGNGYVYASRYVDDQDAERQMIANVKGKLLTDPRILRFKAGMRPHFWEKNCVALGLASGFIEPLESTSISLIQTGVEKLMQFMPDLVLEQDKIDEANRLNWQEYERVRDFIILHYMSSQRNDSEFWRYVTSMAIPNTLQQKLDAFESDGTILLFERESFQEPSWIAMHNGFKRIPRQCMGSTSALDVRQLDKAFAKMKAVIAEAAQYAPTHGEFIADMHALQTVE
jgi:tryptophan 7-halogenase